MKKVITYGTFDLFHYGHYNLLKRAKDLGDYLIVGVSTDELCLKKGKVPVLPLEKRMEIIKNLKFVDEVIDEKEFRQKVQDVLEKQVDIYVSGDEYKDVFDKMDGYEDFIKTGCEIVFLPRTEGVSSSELKEKMFAQSLLDKNKDNIRNKTRR